MSLRNESTAPRPLRTLFAVGRTAELTDGQLLERFASGHGEAAELAFAAIVERHGPMVIRVARSVLNDSHDAQDAFQATFLVLIQKAHGLWVRESLGPWLHQVAFRVASCARTGAERRRRHEQLRARLAEETLEIASSGIDRDCERLLHEEIARLPECFRVPIVLCELEECTHEQAARHIGCPVGTVKSRLARGRERLRQRLRRRGLEPSCMVLGAAMRPECASLTHMMSTTQAVVHAASAAIRAKGPAAVLATEVLRMMSLSRWLKIGAIVLVVGAALSGAGLLAQPNNAGAVARADEDALPVARAADVPVVEIKPGRLDVTITERGYVEALTNAFVTCQISGGATISSVVPEGTKVKKGQLVCELDSTALREKLEKQAVATKAAEAEYQRALAARENAQAKKAPDLDQKTAAEAAALAKWNAAKSNEATLREQVDACKLKAPSDGLVIYANQPNARAVQRFIVAGAFVRERQVIFFIPDLSEIVINTKVHERHVDQLKRGQRARILVDAFPNEAYTGEVLEINPLPDPSSFFTKDVEVYTTKVKLEKPGKGLRPGMTAECKIVIEPLEDVLSVPRTAVFQKDGKDYVNVRKPDGTFEPRAVTLGAANDKRIQVAFGLQRGEVVAADAKKDAPAR